MLCSNYSIAKVKAELHTLSWAGATERLWECIGLEGRVPPSTARQWLSCLCFDSLRERFLISFDFGSRMIPDFMERLHSVAQTSGLSMSALGGTELGHTFTNRRTFSMRQSSISSRITSGMQLAKRSSYVELH